MVQFSDHTALFDAERLALCLLFLYEGWSLAIRRLKVGPMLMFASSL